MSPSGDITTTTANAAAAAAAAAAAYYYYSRLKSHLFSLSYPNLWFSFLLFNARAVTCHFGHYNRFYIYILH